MSLKTRIEKIDVEIGARPQAIPGQQCKEAIQRVLDHFDSRRDTLALVGGLAKTLGTELQWFQEAPTPEEAAALEKWQTLCRATPLPIRLEATPEELASALLFLLDWYEALRELITWHEKGWVELAERANDEGRMIAVWKTGGWTLFGGLPPDWYCTRPSATIMGLELFAKAWARLVELALKVEGATDA